MKKYFLLLILSLSLGISADNLPAQDDSWLSPPDPSWYLHYDKAVEAARKSNKLIYVFRTGSDWCGWCTKLKNDVLSRPKFKRLQKKQFIFLYLDFPRRGNMPPNQKKHNQEIARKLHFGGGVPSAKLITPDGLEVGSLSGYQKEADYIKKLESFIRMKPAAVPEEKDNFFEESEVKTPLKKRKSATDSATSARKLPPPDNGIYMSVISMGTSRTGEGLIFPQSLKLQVGEYIYFRVRCSLPEGRPARVMISSPFGQSKVISSKLGKGNCDLVAGITFITPFEYNEMELRLIPMDANKPLEVRKIPVDFCWFKQRSIE